MLRTLRAFAWLRWRTLLNSLERTGSRDVVGRMALATEQLAPVIMALVMLPSALALAGIAGYAGWSLARTGERVLTFEGVRLLLLAACGFAIVGPIILPAGGRPNAVRLLLLPIPRRVLYVAQVAATLADPWMLLAMAIVVALPIGLAAGAQPAAAAVAMVAGALLLGALAGIVLAVTSAIELAMRNRRRGEVLALMLFLLLPLIGVLPGLLEGQRDRYEPQDERRASQPRREWTALERGAIALVPSEAYATAVGTTARSQYGPAGRPLLTLAAALPLLHGLAYAMFVRVLASPATAGSGAGGSSSPLAGWRVPGLSPGASAVAVSQLRLAFRTPRGRFTLLSPLVMFLPFAVMLLRSPSGIQFAFLNLESGIGLAAFTSFIALLAILPFAMNQFAIDRAGLTLVLLAPLETRALLAGKAAGNALVAAVPAALCIAASLALFPAGDLALWLSIPLALMSAYIIGAPAAAALSAVFPRSVDLNSIGRGSNAHGAAAFLGTLVFAAAGALSVLPVVLATGPLNRPRLAPLLLMGWIAICAAISLGLFRMVVALFERRREHLLMMR